MKTYVNTKAYTWLFLATLFVTSQNWKQPKSLSVGECSNKQWCIHNIEYCSEIKWMIWASLVAQCLRIHLPMQGTRVRSLVLEDPTCRGATKPVGHNYWAGAPQLLNPVCSRARVPLLLSSHAATTEAYTPRARALQQEKPPQWEARTQQQRIAATGRN